MDAIPLQGFKTCLGGCSCKGFDEGRFGEGVVGVFVLICKEWSILGWLVDLKMMGKCFLWVCVAVLSLP